MPVSLFIPHPLPLPLPLSTDERDAMKELRSEISSVIKTLAQEYVEQFPSPVTVPAPSSGKKASSAGETTWFICGVLLSITCFNWSRSTFHFSIFFLISVHSPSHPPLILLLSSSPSISSPPLLPLFSFLPVASSAEGALDAMADRKVNFLHYLSSSGIYHTFKEKLKPKIQRAARSECEFSLSITASCRTSYSHKVYHFVWLWHFCDCTAVTTLMLVCHCSVPTQHSSHLSLLCPTQHYSVSTQHYSDSHLPLLFLCIAERGTGLGVKPWDGPQCEDRTTTPPQVILKSPHTDYTQTHRLHTHRQTDRLTDWQIDKALSHW